MSISNFNEFVSCLLDSEFSIGGENDEGIYSLSSIFNSNIEWHSGIKETDPREWRIRVVEE